MELTYIVIATLIVLLPFILSKLFSGSTQDTKIVLGAAPAVRKKPVTPGNGDRLTGRTTGLPAQVKEIDAIKLAREVGPEVQRLTKAGKKIEAIRLIRDRTGMGLKEAKEMIEKLG